MRDNDSEKYPIRPRGPKHSALQISKVPFMLALYSFPAINGVANLPFQERTTQNWFVLFCLVFPALWLIIGITIQSEEFFECDFPEKEIRGIPLIDIFGLPRSGKWAPDTNPVEPPITVSYAIDHDLDTLRVEYQSLVSEAQYRDKLLIRTTYFALGAIGLFSGILSTTTSSKITPVVAMLASIVMLAFAIAANSYKDSRDALWDRIGRLENSVPAFRGYLTTYNTVRAMNLRMLNTVSFSSYAVGLTIFMTALSYIAYVWSVWPLR